jgi:transcriptional regulator with XRE-family HTH domain
VLGAIVRRQRKLADLTMRELASAVGISNPYLSQIERGLRAPSHAVLQAIADSLDLSIEWLYAEAGFVETAVDEERDSRDSVLPAIKNSSELTAAQRRAMIEIYCAFLDANTVMRRRDA